MPTAAEAIAAWEAVGSLAAVLHIRDADAVALPPLPAGLTSLDCWDCTRLTCLPVLPATLTHLYCSDCPALTCLPPLPAALMSLYCSRCPGLTCIPALPSTLTELICDGCTGLAFLPALPATLAWLDCNNCTGLAFLPTLPATLDWLDCEECTGLACIPALPAALTCLVCSDWMALPDACPQALTWLNNGSPVDRRLWRRQVAERCCPRWHCCTCRKIEHQITHVRSKGTHKTLTTRHAHSGRSHCGLGSRRKPGAAAVHSRC